MNRLFYILKPVIVSLLVVVGPAFANFDLSGEFIQGVCGQTISESVTLTEDIADCPGDGIIIGAHGITLDGDGHKIQGGNGRYGIVVKNKRYVTIKNLFVEGFEQGLILKGSKENHLHTNRIMKNGIGISLSSSRGNTFRNNIIDGNAQGIVLSRHSPENWIYHNIFINNDYQVQDRNSNYWMDPDYELGNFWGNYWGEDDGSDGRLAGDFVGDTRLPHEGVDNAPLLDPSIPERFGPLQCADWWLVWHGGWSPVIVKVINPFGQEISLDKNEIGDNAFYVEDNQVVPGSTLVKIIIHRPCPGESGEGMYSLNMNALADLDFSVTVLGSERGKNIFKYTLSEGLMSKDEIQSIESRLEEYIDPVTGEVNATIQLVVPIDIKPGSDPNCVNPDGNGVIPVAILSTETFDAALVDPASITLDEAPVAINENNNQRMAHVEDINGDGRLDLVVQIIDDLTLVGNGSATLEGNTFDGTEIRGSDSICVVP